MKEQIFVNEFVSITIGLLVFFAGKKLTDLFSVLRNFNIPEAVSGGILASFGAYLLYLAFNLEVVYDLDPRDQMLVFFFITIGLNARVADLVRGGKPLIILLGLTVLYMIAQNVLGVFAAALMGWPEIAGLLVGSASLIGGHGTAIAWAPEIQQATGLDNALELGIAAATLGLVLASVIGGPIAQLLISRFQLAGQGGIADGIVGVPEQAEEDTALGYESFLRALLVIHLIAILGYGANLGLTALGMKFPLFVPCLFIAIIASNTIPHLWPKMPWPARTPALALISELSLAIFIAMSLMGMQLWTIADLAGPLLLIMAIQVLFAVALILFVLFPLMGRNYLAAVLSSGFAGFSLGATPTAIANMTAVTKSHGPAPMAFILLPLVGAFFVDLANVVIIQSFLALFG